MLLSTPLANAQNFKQFIAFGDSTTDTGWFANASTGIPAINVLVANSLAQGGNAHFTGPGPGNAQILAGFFGLSANAANTPGGTNYAIGGAFSDSFFGPGVENLFSFLAGKANPGLPGTASQISNYLASVNGRANPNGLYLIGSGGNDAILAALLGGSAGTQFIFGEAGALVSSIARLQAAGARYIVVTNEYVPPSADATTTAYGNTLLSATWGGLAAAGLRFIPADTFSVIAAVEQNPVAFGITAPISANACVKPAAYPFTTGYGFLCAPTTIPGPNYGYLVSADATQTHLFMDSTHLTEAGQLIVADYIYSLIVAPSQISFLGEAPVKTRTAVVNSIRNQISISQEDRGPGKYHAWVTGDVSYLKMDNYNGFPGDPGTPVVLTGGFDYKYAHEWLLGAAFSVSSTKQSFSNTGNFKQDEFAASIYAAYRNRSWWGDIIGGAGTLHDPVNRLVPIGITIQPNNGDANGTNYSLALEAGYDFRFAGLTHGPLAGIILQRIHVGSFTEAGSFTSLAFDDQFRNSAVSELGYQVSYNSGFCRPFAKIAWNHELASTDRFVTAYLTTIAAPGYSMPAVISGKDWGSISAGTAVKIAKNVTGLMTGYAQFAEKNVTVYGGQIGFNVAFDVPPTPDALVVKAPRK
jgi:outer membrane lipase/esterase